MWKPTPLPYKELPGLSARLLSDHHKLYEGYVKRWNKAYQLLEQWEPRDEDQWDYARLVAEEGFLRNAGLLHEMYFDQLKPGGGGDPVIFFGDEDSYNYHISRIRRAALGTTGWVILSTDILNGTLLISSMKDHDTGFPVGAIPLLVVDVYEHAYAKDYGIQKSEYLNAFFRNVDWNEIQMRFNASVTLEDQTS